MSAPVFGLPPLAGSAPALLILGSMPGPESLRRQAYYAHPRNAFWPILFDFFGEAPSGCYAQRRALILQNGVALWDVLAACERPGALDAAIRRPVPNDLAAFLRRYPTVCAVLLNGTRAAAEFGKLHLEIPAAALPSTSPAYAAMPRERKTALWHAALRAHLPGR